MVKPIKVIERFIDVQDRIGDFVQNGPDAGLPGHVRNEYRKRCDQFANLPGWARALGNGSTNTMNRICQPYWSDNGNDGPVLQQPFTGGQCPTNYRVTFRRRQFSGGSWGWSSNVARNGLGPVGVQSFQGPLSCLGQNGSVSTAYNLTFNGVVSGPTPLVNQCSDVSPGYEIISVVRLDGQPDVCGDPPPTLIPGPNPPANPGPTPGPEPTDDPSGDPTPFLPIPPYLDPIFGPIPVDPGEDDGGGGDGGDGGGGGAPPETPSGEPDAVGDPVASGGEEGADSDFGPPPEGKVWVGAIVEVDAPDRLGTVPGTVGNVAYTRVLGNCSLKYGATSGSSVRIRSQFTELFRPNEVLQVTGARARVFPGCTFTIRPVAATKCPESTCEPPGE